MINSKYKPEDYETTGERSFNYPELCRLMREKYHVEITPEELKAIHPRRNLAQIARAVREYGERKEASVKLGYLKKKLEIAAKEV